jgi:hypothetical protein
LIAAKGIEFDRSETGSVTIVHLYQSINEMQMKKSLLLLFVLSHFYSANAQQRDPLSDSLAAARIHLQINNGWFLGAWAAVNMVQGSISAGNATGSDKYFHRMNVYWNIANAAVAGFTLLASNRELKNVPDADRNLRRQQLVEKALLMNTGLDAAYIMTGIYLKERGNRLNNAQSTGYGNSLLVQGSFLLIFDLIQYGEHRRNGRIIDKNTHWRIGSTNDGIGLTYKFP